MEQLKIMNRSRYLIIVFIVIILILLIPHPFTNEVMNETFEVELTNYNEELTVLHNYEQVEHTNYYDFVDDPISYGERTQYDYTIVSYKLNISLLDNFSFNFTYNSEGEIMLFYFLDYLIYSKYLGYFEIDYSINNGGEVLGRGMYYEEWFCDDITQINDCIDFFIYFRIDGSNTVDHEINYEISAYRLFYAIFYFMYLTSLLAMILERKYDLLINMKIYENIDKINLQKPKSVIILERIDILCDTVLFLIAPLWFLYFIYLDVTYLGLISILIFIGLLTFILIIGYIMHLFLDKRYDQELRKYYKKRNKIVNEWNW